MRNAELTNPLKGVGPGVKIKIIKHGKFVQAVREDGFGSMTDGEVENYKEARPDRYPRYFADLFEKDILMLEKAIRALDKLTKTNMEFSQDLEDRIRAMELEKGESK